MRILSGFVAIVIIALLIIGAPPVLSAAQAATVQTATPSLVSGRTLVLFGDRVWHRNETALVGVEQALAGLPGVTILVPRQRPHSLRDADLRGVATVVEIFAAEITHREDHDKAVHFSGVSIRGTFTVIRVRLGLRFLNVSDNAAHLELCGSREAEGTASGMTRVSTFTRWGSYVATTHLNLETAAFAAAAATIVNR
jgi:hypothetical protein